MQVSEDASMSPDELTGVDLVLRRLLLAHETWFDVERDYAFGDREFPGYAEFHSHGEQYVLTKKAKLWEVDAFEYLFFQTYTKVTKEDVEDMIDFMTTVAIDKVKPDPNHMQSFVSLVMVAESVDPEAAALIKRTSFRKNYAFGFRGWADLRLAAIDLSSQTVMSNGAGKEMKTALAANAGFPVPAKRKLFGGSK